MAFSLFKSKEFIAGSVNLSEVSSLCPTRLGIPDPRPLQTRTVCLKQLSRNRPCAGAPGLLHPHQAPKRQTFYNISKEQTHQASVVANVSDPSPKRLKQWGFCFESLKTAMGYIASSRPDCGLRRLIKTVYSRVFLFFLFYCSVCMCVHECICVGQGIIL